MPTAHESQQPGYRDPTRRLRFDGTSSIARRHKEWSSLSRAGTLPAGHSGKRLVIVAGFTVLVLWGVLNLVFRDWRERYRERAAYGSTAVVPAIDPLAQVQPPGVSADAWLEAVLETRSMLTTVTSSNLLDLNEMKALRSELDQVVGRALDRPETACDQLASLWDMIGERAEFLFRDSRSQSGERHRRPEILPSYGATRVAPAVDALAEITPPDVRPADWRLAVSQTHDMLVTLTGSNVTSIQRMRAVRARLDRLVDQARAHPDDAVAILATIWNETADRAETLQKDERIPGGTRRPRPAILPPNPAQPPSGASGGSLSDFPNGAVSRSEHRTLRAER
jgi:hypothetical protein